MPVTPAADAPADAIQTTPATVDAPKVPHPSSHLLAPAASKLPATSPLTLPSGYLLPGMINTSPQIDSSSGSSQPQPQQKVKIYSSPVFQQWGNLVYKSDGWRVGEVMSLKISRRTWIVLLPSESCSWTVYWCYDRLTSPSLLWHREIVLFIMSNFHVRIH